jgi:hypothetical protein
MPFPAGRATERATAPRIRRGMAVSTRRWLRLPWHGAVADGPIGLWLSVQLNIWPAPQAARQRQLQLLLNSAARDKARIGRMQGGMGQANVFPSGRTYGCRVSKHGGGRSENCWHARVGPGISLIRLRPSPDFTAHLGVTMWRPPWLKESSMCKLIVAAAMLVAIPAFFFQAQAATPGPGSISQSTVKAESPIETTACARRRVCGPRGCAWRTVCGGRRW